MQLLKQLSDALVKNTNTSFRRFLYDDIPWHNRLTAIVGPRGVGKTTMLLQHIKLQRDISKSLYVSAEAVYFTHHTLFETAQKLVQANGTFLAIDEIHKYDGWALELKMIYDNLPELQVVFTGSSILDIYRGTADLSRRALIFHLPGMSFREYVNFTQGTNLPPLSLDDITNNAADITSTIPHPLPLFADYLRHGYYPFSADPGFNARLDQIVTMTLENDIPLYANLTIATARKLKKLMQIIAESVPFKPNFSSLALATSIDRNKLPDYLSLIERSGLISQLPEPTTGIRSLAKIEKIYLQNTNLAYALTAQPDIGNLRETFFLSQMSIRHNVTASKTSDFEINGRTFEVGGRKKTHRQTNNTPNSFLVKDDIETGFANTLPLYTFGLSY